MLFFTKGRKYKNLSIWDEKTKKIIAKFENNKFETEEEIIIEKLKSNKYKMVNYDKKSEELEKEKKAIEVKRRKKEKDLREEIKSLKEENEALKNNKSNQIEK